MIVLPPYDETEARRDPAVRLQPAFQLAIEDVRPVVAARFPGWREIPRLQGHAEAFQDRMAAVTSGKKARVDFKRTFHRFIKSRFPDYPVAVDTGELFRCIKPLDEKLALGIDWLHKAAWGMGKMLNVEVGARWDNKNAVIYHALPYFLGADEQVDWAYITKEDLEACLEGAAEFLDVLLPPLGEALRKRMYAEVGMGGAGAISAQEGYAIARPLVDALKPGMNLQGITVLQGTGRRWGMLLSPEGRLRAHAMWGFHFRGTPDAGARVDVPSVGGAVVHYYGRWALPGELIGEQWIDTTEALTAAQATGRLRPGAVVTALTLEYSRPYVEGPSWRIDLMVPGTYPPSVVFVDARDGHVVFV